MSLANCFVSAFFGLGENGNQLIFGQFRQRGHHRQPADEFGNETVIQQILRFGVL